MINDGDVNVVVDKRELNQGRKEQFKAFRAGRGRFSAGRVWEGC